VGERVYVYVRESVCVCEGQRDGGRERLDDL